MNNTLVYLAVPYSHPDPSVKERRFQTVNKVAGILMQRGLHIFSPISHTHPIAICHSLPEGWEFWKDYDEAVLRHCCKVLVLMLDGWKDSEGVNAEINAALDLGLPVEYLDPEEFEC